jgi:uncharacterized protein GlcG (DUF336 family)
MVGGLPMKLEIAQRIVTAALIEARSKGMKPLAVAVLDARGSLRALAAEDGTSLKRAEVAIGKAYGAVALGTPSRSLGTRAKSEPHFIAAASHIVGGALVPVAGGVLVRDGTGALLGAVGVSGDTSDNDEVAALAGIAAVGLKAEAGN